MSNCGIFFEFSKKIKGGNLKNFIWTFDVPVVSIPIVLILQFPNDTGC